MIVNDVISLAAGLAGLVLMALGFLRPDVGRYLFIYTSPIILTVLILHWLIHLRRYFREYKLFEVINRFKPLLISAGILVVLSGFLVGPKMRVAQDEARLLLTAESMTKQFRADYARQVIHYPQETTVYERRVDKRPLLFPYLTHLANRLSGTRWVNGVVINQLALFFLLAVSGIYMASLRRAGPFAGLSLQLFIVCHPVVLWVANSAGLEALYILFGSLLFMLLGFKGDDTKSKFRFPFIWLTLILFAHTRYEAVLITLGLPVIYLIFSVRARRALRSQFQLIALLPFYLLPVFLQRKLTYGDYDLQDGYKDAFSIGHLGESSAEFIRALADFGSRVPFAQVICLSGLICIAGFLLSILWRRKWSGATVAILAGAALWIVTGMYHDTNPLHAATVRYFAFFCVGLSWAMTYGIYCLLNKKIGWAIPLLAVLLLASQMLVAAADKTAEGLSLGRRHRFVLEKIKTYPKDKTLVIHQWPELFASHGYSSITQQTFHRNKERVEDFLKHSDKARVVVAQRRDINTNKYYRRDKIPKGFKIRSLASYEVPGGGYIDRLARLELPDEDR